MCLHIGLNGKFGGKKAFKGGREMREKWGQRKMKASEKDESFFHSYSTTVNSETQRQSIPFHILAGLGPKA